MLFGTTSGPRNALRWDAKQYTSIRDLCAIETSLIRLPDGSTHSFLDGDEKGIDVRIALDIISLAHKRHYDVALVFCRDQDLSEVADEIRAIAQDQKRWIKIASAYPFSPAVKHWRGIEKTDWVRIDRATYDACIDTRDYRPKPPVAPKSAVSAPVAPTPKPSGA